MEMLSEVWRGFPTLIRMAMARRGSMCAETSSAITNLVIQSSSQDANWYMLVCIFAGSAYNSSTKSSLVASSFGKISFQHINRMVGELAHPRTPALRESHSGSCAREVRIGVELRLNHMWLELVLCGHRDTLFICKSLCHSGTAPILIALFRLVVHLVPVSDSNVIPCRHSQCNVHRP